MIKHFRVISFIWIFLLGTYHLSSQTALTDLVAVEQTGNLVASTHTQNGWNRSGFATEQTIEGNGYVEWVASTSNKHIMVGLSAINPNPHFNSIDYAIYMVSNGTLRIYESGVLKGSFGAYAIGDRFKVERNGTTITYFRNQELLYTSILPAGLPLMGDAALHTVGSSLQDLVLVDVDSTPLEPGISIKDEVEVIQVGNGIFSTQAANGWGTAGFATQDSFSNDGYIEWEVVTNRKHVMGGLSSNNPSAHFNTIDYAIYIVSGSAVRVYESGKFIGNFGTYTIGDKFKVERKGILVSYSKNGEVFYTSSVPSIGSLLGDFAFWHTENIVYNLTLVDNGDSSAGGSLWSQEGDSDNIFYENGKVAIGVQSVPEGYLLAVDGKIRTREVRVDIDVWPDYVFQRDYELPSLESVQKFIAINGHLKDIPSAELIEKEGIAIGDMNKKLLEKIEELTLYLIEQNSRIKSLEQQRGALLERLEKLESN